ncbi:MAG: peptidase S41, partial [FCB group bacterium]
MKKIFCFFLIFILASTAYCQTKTNKEEFKANNDTAFDKGSNIKFGEITQEKLNDLSLLGMVWGFLKYYHPNIAKGDYNWDYELFRILPKFLQSKNNVDRDNILVNWVKSLGITEPDNEKKDTTEKKAEIKLNPDLYWIEHINLSADIVYVLTNVKNAKRNDKQYYVALGLRAGNPIFKNEKGFTDMKYPDAGFRLLSLYRYWNIIQYYYPYKNLIEEDWKGVLKELIPTFINAKNEIEYKLAVLELMARVHDTHSNILGQDEALTKYRGANVAAVQIKFVENKVVVIDYYDNDLGSKTGLHPGDVITKLNGRTIKQILDEKLKYTPASNYPTQLRDIAKLMLQTNDSTMSIEFIRNGKTQSLVINTYPTS